MYKLNVNNVRMLSQVLQQYRDLTLNSNKFFYYGYGKLDIKIQSILKERGEDYSDSESIEMLISLDVNITYEELIELLGFNKIDKRTINSMIRNIKSNSSLVIDDGDESTIIFIYKNIVFDSINRRVKIEFNEDAVLLFQKIREMPYSNIEFEEVVKLDNKYQLNLYLYAITILRGSKGIVKISIEKVREILAGDSIIDDYNFITRFINKPAKEITDNENLKMEIRSSREGQNIVLHVLKK